MKRKQVKVRVVKSRVPLQTNITENMPEMKGEINCPDCGKVIECELSCPGYGKDPVMVCWPSCGNAILFECECGWWWADAWNRTNLNNREMGVFPE